MARTRKEVSENDLYKPLSISERYELIKRCAERKAKQWLGDVSDLPESDEDELRF